MVEQVLSYGLCYAGYAAQLILFTALATRGRWKRLTNLFVYVAVQFTVDGAGRSYVRYRFGLQSSTYSYFYWLSDDVLALAAFLLVCSFFRRACNEKKELWRRVLGDERFDALTLRAHGKGVDAARPSTP